jgi:hypothetical protein
MCGWTMTYFLLGIVFVFLGVLVVGFIISLDHTDSPE